MHIQESFICGKHTAADCEDGMVITPHFAAVIDGSTSKTPLRLNPTMKNGRFAMLIISDYIQQMPPCATIDDFCQGVTMRIANEYAKLGITAQMTAHPEERLTALQRAKLIKNGMSPTEARRTIEPQLIKAMLEGQNRQYAVIDGTPIYMPGTRTIPVSRSVVLASDGYPTLHPTLNDSEAALAQQLANDPQNIATFIATKGLVEGNSSFDDRTYISLTV